MKRDDRGGAISHSKRTSSADRAEKLDDGDDGRFPGERPTLRRVPAAAEDYRFEDLFDLDEIQKIQDSFAKATGIGSIITYPDGRPITRPSNFCRLCQDIIRKTDIGLKKCLQSDSSIGWYNTDGPTIMPCHSGGLWDGGVSITVGGRHVANWLIGQVRNEELQEEQIVAYADDIGVNRETFREALAEVTYMSLEQFREIGNTLYLFAKQLSEIAYQNLQRKRIIDELRRAEERRDKLENQLRHAQKLEAVGRLAGGVAHDFNNILSVINGYTELMLFEKDLCDSFRQRLEIINGAGMRAARLTQQLVAFSRKQIIAPRAIHLDLALAETDKMLARLLGEDVEVSSSYADGLWPVKLDHSQLEQIVINLAVNARDAMPKGGKIVFEARNITLTETSVYDQYEMASGDYVQLAVTDNGVGMSKEVQEHIFEPFYTTKDAGKGTGLGLSTVYGIVKQNSGYITVYSEEGLGTTFKIYFPRMRDQQPGGLPEQGLHEIAGLPSGHERILLVEDEQQVRELCATILSRQGYTVLEAINGRDALNVLGRFHGQLDLLLTDVVMPEMSGPEVASAIIEKHPRVRVIYMSGYTENTIVHHGVLNDNINFLQKPVTPRELLVQVRKILDTP